MTLLLTILLILNTIIAISEGASVLTVSAIVMCGLTLGTRLG